jgi:hypothetical protein
MVEHSAVNRRVASSNLARGAKSSFSFNQLPGSIFVFFIQEIIVSYEGVQRSWKPLQALFDRYLGRVKVQGCAVISRLRFEDLDPQVQGLIVPLHVSDEVVAQFVLVSVAEYLSAESL